MLENIIYFGFPIWTALIIQTCWTVRRRILLERHKADFATWLFGEHMDRNHQQYLLDINIIDAIDAITDFEMEHHIHPWPRWPQPELEPWSNIPVRQANGRIVLKNRLDYEWPASLK